MFFVRGYRNDAAVTSCSLACIFYEDMDSTRKFLSRRISWLIGDFENTTQLLLTPVTRYITLSCPVCAGGKVSTRHCSHSAASVDNAVQSLQTRRLFLSLSNCQVLQTGRVPLPWFLTGPGFAIACKPHPGLDHFSPQSVRVRFDQRFLTMCW